MLIIVLLALSGAHLAEAALRITPAARKTTGSIELTRSLQFNLVDSASAISYLVFDGFDLSGGLPNSSSFDPMVFTQNSSEEFRRGLFVDASGIAGPDISAGDAVVQLSVFSLEPGSSEVAPLAVFLETANDANTSDGRSIVLSAFNQPFQRAESTFNTPIVFFGSAFLADGAGNQISNLVAVPEPAACAALAGIVGCVLLGLRRRAPRESSVGSAD